MPRFFTADSGYTRQNKAVGTSVTIWPGRLSQHKLKDRYTSLNIFLTLDQRWWCCAEYLLQQKVDIREKIKQSSVTVWPGRLLQQKLKETKRAVRLLPRTLYQRNKFIDRLLQQKLKETKRAGRLFQQALYQREKVIGRLLQQKQRNKAKGQIIATDTVIQKQRHWQIIAAEILRKTCKSNQQRDNAVE